MSFNGDSFSGYDDRRNEAGNYNHRSYSRDIDYRRDRQRREAQDYDEWEARRNDSEWYSNTERHDNNRHGSRESSWQERPSRDDYDERSLNHGSDDMCTIFVGGLPTFITECDIEDNLNSFGLRARDIRVVKKKDPGSNRGFAFVEFYSASEAQEWMDQTKGILNFCEGISTTLSVSRSWGGREERLPRRCDSPPHRISDTPPTVYKGDWKCVKCGCINFRRRDKCFKCKIERQESDYEITSQDGSDFIGIAPTETLLIRGLSPITDEARVKQVLFYATKVTVKDVFIARNPIDHSSAGFGFLLVESSNDSLSVLDALRGSGHPLEIDGCPVQINFSKMNFLNVMVMLSHRGFATKSLSNQEAACQREEEENLNKNQQHQKASEGDSNKNNINNCDSFLASPDTNRYVFDETSGYYYDPTTELYYDAGSQYFYDSKKSCFLYWDGRARKYVEVVQSPELNQTCDDSSSLTNHMQTEVKSEKAEKAKQAKKIAMEMERWAKHQNAQKEGSFKKPLPIAAAFKKPSSADAGFKMEKPKIDIKLKKEEKSNVLSKLVASYGDSDSDDDTTSNPTKELESLEEKLTDWDKLTCLLCKRVFTSLDILKKHKILSDLHKVQAAQVMVAVYEE